MGILTRATRSLVRRKTRMLIVTAALTLALMLIVILPPSINARQELTHQVIENMAGNNEVLTNTLTLSATAIECNYPAKPYLETFKNESTKLYFLQDLMGVSLGDNITSIPDVVDIIPLRLERGAAFGGRYGAYAVYGVAVDTAAFQKDPSLLPVNITQGRNLQLGDSGVVVLDEITATNLTVGVGDVVTLSGHPLTVIGIEGKSDMWWRVGQRATMSLSDAQIVTNSADQVSSFIVFVNDVDNVNSVVARIRGLDSDLEVSSGITQLNTVQPMKDQIAALTRAAENNLNQVWSVGMVEIGVSVVAAVAVILFLMLYSVRERTREIGTLKAMGASTSKVLGQFMVEGVLLSVVAAVIAIVLSIFVLAPIASLILPVPVQQGVTVMLDANGTMYLGASNVGPRPILPGESPPSIIATSLSVEWLALCFGVAVLLGALGSLYPALKAARTKPAEAMRYE